MESIKDKSIEPSFSKKVSLCIQGDCSIINELGWDTYHFLKDLHIPDKKILGSLWLFKDGRSFIFALHPKYAYGRCPE